MKKIVSILLIVASILIVFSTLIFASGIDVKDYIKGKFPVIFNIYLAPLGELDEYEKEYIDLLQNLPEEEQKNLAKEVYNNGFSRDILERIKKEGIITKPETAVGETNIEEPLIQNISKWVYNKEIDPIDDKVIITFTLKNEDSGIINDLPIYLILRYKNNKTDVYINWNREIYSGLEGWINIYIRFNDNEASKENWNFTGSFKEYLFGKNPMLSQYTFNVNHKVKFIKNLIDADRFVAQIKGKNKMDLTAVFDVRGLKEAIEPYNDILNWIKD
jgi:type VI secretion system protein VasI